MFFTHLVEWFQSCIACKKVVTGPTVVRLIMLYLKVNGHHFHNKSKTNRFTLLSCFFCSFVVVIMCHVVISAQLKCLLHGHSWAVIWENSLCSFNMIFFKCLVNEEYCNFLCSSHLFKHLHCKQPIVVWWFSTISWRWCFLHHFAWKDGCGYFWPPILIIPAAGNAKTVRSLPSWRQGRSAAVRPWGGFLICLQGHFTTALSQKWSFQLVEREHKALPHCFLWPFITSFNVSEGPPHLLS